LKTAITDEFEPWEPERPQIYVEKGDLAYWAGAAMSIEKARVAAEVSLAHMLKYGGDLPDRREYLKLLREAEAYADRRLKALIVAHPTYEWARRIKGIGKQSEVFAKVVGEIERFGKFYDVGDPDIPYYVKRKPQEYRIVIGGEVQEKVGIFVKGIERVTMASKLRKYAGLYVDEEGHAPKRQKGEKLPYNGDLRMLLEGRLATNLNRAGGVWSQEYHDIRQRMEGECADKGIKLVPTPKERQCLDCGEVVVKKATHVCPRCGGTLSAKEEPEGYIYRGHFHIMVVRKMMQRFLVCLWYVWRQAENLPTPVPYAVKYYGHKPIDPWSMVDDTEGL